MKRHSFQEAAKRHYQKKYHKSREEPSLSKQLTKAKTIPNVTESKPVMDLIPSGTRKHPTGNKEELMKWLKRMGTGA
jgi:hypothetical protein